MFKGSITALVSPFNNGNIDIGAFENHIEFQINSGSNGIVPCGTTGESTLSRDEHQQLIERSVKVSNGRVLLLLVLDQIQPKKLLHLQSMQKNLKLMLC